MYLFTSIFKNTYLICPCSKTMRNRHIIICKCRYMLEVWKPWKSDRSQSPPFLTRPRTATSVHLQNVLGASAMSVAKYFFDMFIFHYFIYRVTVYCYWLFSGAVYFFMFTKLVTFTKSNYNYYKCPTIVLNLTYNDIFSFAKYHNIILV